MPATIGFRVSRKVSLGSHKWLDVRRYEDPGSAYTALRNRGFEIWASAIHGESVPLSHVPIDRPTALVFGNEHEGLSESAVQQADGRFTRSDDRVCREPQHLRGRRRHNVRRNAPP